MMKQTLPPPRASFAKAWMKASSGYCSRSGISQIIVCRPQFIESPRFAGGSRNRHPFFIPLQGKRRFTCPLEQFAKLVIRANGGFVKPKDRFKEFARRRVIPQRNIFHGQSMPDKSIV